MKLVVTRGDECHEVTLRAEPGYFIKAVTGISGTQLILRELGKPLHGLSLPAYIANEVHRTIYCNQAAGKSGLKCECSSRKR